MAKKNTPYSKWLFILFFLGILTFAIIIIKPFIATIIVSAIISYIFYPVYKKLNTKISSKGACSAIIIILLLIILIIPMVLITGKITQETYEAYLKAKEVFGEDTELKNLCLDKNGFVCSSFIWVQNFDNKYKLDLGEKFSQSVSRIAAKAITTVSNFIFDLPGFFLHFFIMLFVTFYMFIDGPRMLKALKRSLPLKEIHKEHIFKQFNDVIFATIYGSIVVAVIQGVVATIGFFIFGVTSPIMLGLITIIAAFIPLLGAALIWFPAVVTLLVKGILTENNDFTFRAIGLFIWSLILVSSIDNVLKPKIIGSKAKMHPLVILLGVFGGLSAFGFVGIMVGPLLLALFITALKIYESEKEYLL